MATKRKSRTPQHRDSPGTTKLPTELQADISGAEDPAPAEANDDVEAGFAEAPEANADVETIHDEDTSTGRHVDSIEKI